MALAWPDEDFTDSDVEDYSEDWVECDEDADDPRDPYLSKDLEPCNYAMSFMADRAFYGGAGWRPTAFRALRDVDAAVLVDSLEDEEGILLESADTDLFVFDTDDWARFDTHQHHSARVHEVLAVLAAAIDELDAEPQPPRELVEPIAERLTAYAERLDRLREALTGNRPADGEEEPAGAVVVDWRELNSRQAALGWAGVVLDEDGSPLRSVHIESFDIAMQEVDDDL